jgi:hypothetical protein
MAIPSTREQLKQNCLRRLGKPVIEINVSDEQLEDRIDEALQYYQDYHFDGAQRIFLSHQITDEDKTNRYIPVDDSIIGVINIFDIGDSYSTNNLFSLRYQLSLTDLYAFTSGNLSPYYMALQNVAMAEELLVGKQPLRFNRHQNRVFIDMDWNLVTTSEFIIVEAYQIVDPETFTDVYGDRWLARYTTALIKRQWGENLSKFEGVQLPGGLTFNGQRILQEANQEIEKLEEEMITSYSLPVSDMLG